MSDAALERRLAQVERERADLKSSVARIIKEVTHDMRTNLYALCVIALGLAGFLPRLACGDADHKVDGETSEVEIYERGKLLFEEGQFGKAIEVFSLVVDSPEYGCLAIANRARSHLQLGQLVVARSEIEKAAARADAEIREKPISAHLFEQRAWASIVSAELAEATSRRDSKGDCVKKRREHLESAASDLLRALTIQPDRLKSLRLQAFVSEELERWDMALSSYNTALKLASTDYTLNLDRARVYLELGGSAEVVADCDTVLRDQAARETAEVAKYAFALRGAALTMAGRWEDAFADYDEAIKLCPGDGKLFLGKAETYYRKGESHKALLEIENAIAHEQTIVEDYETFELFWYCITPKNARDAIPVLDRLCSSYPNRGECFLMRSWAYMAIDLSHARDDFRSASELPLSSAGRVFAGYAQLVLRGRRVPLGVRPTPAFEDIWREQ